MKQNVKVILASGSPRRKEMFERIGIRFSVVKSDAEETVTETNPADIVKQLSKEKAAAVRKQLKTEDFLCEGFEEGTVIIGADTIVVSEGQILGKPRDEEDALCILMSLSGKDHFVYTGVCCLYLDKNGNEVEDKSISFAEKTVVTMYPFSEEEAKAYIQTKEPMDKAGGYGIQGIGSLLVKEIHGDYQNVVGFPLAVFFRLGCQKNFFRL